MIIHSVTWKYFSTHMLLKCQICKKQKSNLLLATAWAIRSGHSVRNFLRLQHWSSHWCWPSLQLMREKRKEYWSSVIDLSINMLLRLRLVKPATGVNYIIHVSSDWFDYYEIGRPCEVWVFLFFFHSELIILVIVLIRLPRNGREWVSPLPEQIFLANKSLDGAR